MELEIDEGGEDHDNAERLLFIANNIGNRIYCKHDGSIENGFKIVSHPMTLEYHLNEMPWQKVFDKAISMGYYSHKTATCGLHCHVNRTAFGDNYDTQEEAIARVVYFVEKHWDKLLKFSRRTEENINRWASRYGISSNAKDTYKNAKDNRRGRYVAVNLENDNTIEFRIFRGTLRYATFANLSELTNSLAEQSALRGTDATGIAFNNKSNLSILKDAKSAYRMAMRHSGEICSLIGHTRHSTQGSEKRNYNNHPFYGKTKNTMFALAHNGVLMNDTELRKELKLPKTKIETDSYIAVQLIESQNNLDFESLKYMAEKLRGSFSFSVLDNKDDIYLVKGDSPLSILHFPKEKMYVFSSTEEILFKALIDSKLFSSLKNGDFEEVSISDGDILKICSNGKLIYDKFEYSIYNGRHWWDFDFAECEYPNDDYISDLKAVASYQGYSPDDIDKLLKKGFSPFEIEDFIYEY